MRFIATSTTMLKALQKLLGVVSSNTVLSVLEDFHFNLAGNTLTITATDLETTIELSLLVSEGEDDGQVCIPAKMLVEHLKSLPEQPVTFLIDPDKLSLDIRTSSGRYRIGCEKSEDFPKSPEPSDTSEFTIPAVTLHEGIMVTLFATSSETLRPAMTGVLLHLTAKAVTFVSTDTHRMVVLERSDIDAPDDAQIVVPKKALQQLRNVLPTDETPLHLAYNASHLFIETGHVKISCRLIDAAFPDYRAVMPMGNDLVLTVNRADLVASLKRVGLFATRTTEQVVLTAEAGTLQLQAADHDMNYEAQEVIPADWKGDRFQIAFNGKLLAEMATNLSGNEMQLLLSTPARAALLCPVEQSEGEHLQMLLMPLMAGA